MVDVNTDIRYVFLMLIMCHHSFSTLLYNIKKLYTPSCGLLLCCVSCSLHSSQRHFRRQSLSIESKVYTFERERERDVLKTL